MVKWILFVPTKHTDVVFRCCRVTVVRPDVVGDVVGYVIHHQMAAITNNLSKMHISRFILRLFSTNVSPILWSNSINMLLNRPTAV